MTSNSHEIVRIYRPSKRTINAANSSGQLSNWIGERLDNLDIPNTENGRLAGACFQVALAHHVSMAILLGKGSTTSAFALLRPQIDAYVRGLWLHLLATDIEIEGVKNGDDPPPTRKIAGDLEKIDKFDPDSLSKIANGIWPAVCDFTHTGIRVLHTHLRSGEIRPSFTDDEIESLLFDADIWALLTAIALAQLANNNSATEEISAYTMKLIEAQRGD